MFGDASTGEYNYSIKKLGDVAEAGSSNRVFTTEFVETGIPFYRGTEIGEFANGEQPSDPYYISEKHYDRLAINDTRTQKGDEKLLPYYKQSERFEKMQKRNRYYEVELTHLRMRKVSFRSHLDIIYPLLDKCFKGSASLYDPVMMEILKKYPHPALLLKHRKETIVKAIEKKTDHKPEFITAIVDKMYECTQHCYSGADENDIEVTSLPQMIKDLQAQMELCDSILQDLISESKEVSYFPCIVSIVGIGENLAARLIAELGDMTRFKSRRAIAAYAGLNPKMWTAYILP